MGGFDGGLADFFDVHRMAERGEGMAVVDFEDLRLTVANSQEQNPFGPGESEHGSAALQLVADILAPIANGFKPTIGFLCHAEASCQQRSCSPRETVRIPSRERSLSVANNCRSGCTPPVAVSNSAAVIKRRLARVVAASSDISEGRGLPHFSKKWSTLLMLREPEPDPA